MDDATSSLSHAPSAPKSLRMATLALCVLTLLQLSGGGVAAISGGTNDGSERWGYVQVRPKAHLFWWYYRSPHRASSPGKPWPTILWLQGGPVRTAS
ncbi:Os03g0393375 [Oryza sativa Japonica Group]|uniref:Os03g0393375 protein n=1 Tax=Oryza sativa subsp. japonica TaxID=39947 RepID=A0A0P0VZ77_ORYSJ|nr:Os03g0393375 [Oryza sativa Japonica Group]